MQPPIVDKLAKMQELAFIKTVGKQLGCSVEGPKAVREIGVRRPRIELTLRCRCHRSLRCVRTNQVDSRLGILVVLNHLGQGGDGVFLTLLLILCGTLAQAPWRPFTGSIQILSKSQEPIDIFQALNVAEIELESRVFG